MPLFKVLLPACGTFPLRSAYSDLDEAAEAVKEALAADVSTSVHDHLLDLLHASPTTTRILHRRHSRRHPAALRMPMQFNWFVDAGVIYEATLSFQHAGPAALACVLPTDEGSL